MQIYYNFSMKKTVFLLSAVFLTFSLFAETKVKETVYVKDGNQVQTKILWKNYRIENRDSVYVYGISHELTLSAEYRPVIIEGVDSTAIDDRPPADSSFEHEIVFPSDYALEKIFVRCFWRNGFDSVDEERFSEILSFLEKSELRLLRNTIYARYNYPFKTKDLQEIFSGIFDYLPNPNVTSETIEKEISVQHKKILDMIIAEENNR